MKGLWVLASVTLVIAACSGGSAPTVNDPPPPPPPAAIVGLTLPTNLSLLSANPGNSNGGSTKPSGVNAKSGEAGTHAIRTESATQDFDDPGTDYAADQAEVYVHDESMRSLNMINEIICYMGQTGATEMVNQGAYVALINEDRCRQGENQSAAADSGQSSGRAATEFARWVIVSERPDNDSPQTVRLWVPEPGDGDDEFGPEHILVEVTMPEGASNARPFGGFVMNFRGVVDGARFGMAPGTEVEVMTGTLQTVDNAAGSPQFRFLNLGGDALGGAMQTGFGFEQAVNVRLDDAAGSSGSARTYSADYWMFDGPLGPEAGSRFDRLLVVTLTVTR